MNFITNFNCFLLFSIFLFISIGNQHGNVNGLKCHRQPVHAENITEEILNKLEDYECNDSRGEIYCLEATNCDFTRTEMKLSTNVDMIKHNVRECLPSTFILPASSPHEAPKKIDVQDACEQFYTPVRGCETCRICKDRDFCNNLRVTKEEEEATNTTPNPAENKEEANNALGNWMVMDHMFLLVFIGIGIVAYPAILVQFTD